MPSTYNGIGTTLIKASKAYPSNGQFDAIEAFVVLNFPLVPYKAVHVLSHEGDRYRSFDLKSSSFIYLKGIVNGWANNLMFFSIPATIICAIAMATMDREVGAFDYWIWTVLISAIVIGVMLKFLWIILDMKSRAIKSIIGPHELGTSDPFDWSDALANTERRRALDERPDCASLVEIGRGYQHDNQSMAMCLARLAMRTGEEVEAQKLYVELMNSR